MTKSTILILSISLFSVLVSPSLFAATKAELKNTDLSKSELCDFAIQALGELLKKESGAAKPAITKEQCMAISDDDINKAAKKIMYKQ